MAAAAHFESLPGAADALHPHAALVASAGAQAVVRADALYFFAILHAERPSAAEAAGARLPEGLRDFALAFEVERVWLTQTLARAGPTRDHRDLGRHEQLVRHQREALLTLAQSERTGCAAGAVAALAADWPGIRAALSGAAGAEEAPPLKPPFDAASARAFAFGAAQLRTVHRTVWDLLEARHAVRLRSV